MEGEEGDFAATSNTIVAQRGTPLPVSPPPGRNASQEPPPGIRGGFLLNPKDPESFAPIGSAFYSSALSLNVQIAVLGFAGNLLGIFVSQRTKEEWANDAAGLRFARDTLEAKEEAAKLAKDLIEFSEGFTPPEIPPPDQKQDPNQNVAAIEPDDPGPGIDIDVA